MRQLLSIILTLYSISTLAQNDITYFKHITSDEGLPSNYVEAIYQTLDGFMWFGSSDGLSRFDGLSFLNFRNNQSDTTSLIDNEIKCLTEDKYNRLWVGTQRGLAYLNLKTYKFKWFTKEFSENIGSCWISSLSDIGNNKLLIGTYGYGLFVLDITTNKIVKNYTRGEGDNKLINNNIRFICPDGSGKIWLATDDGLDVIQPESGKVNHMLKGQVIFNICVDNTGNILATSLNSNNLYTINSASSEILNIEKVNIKSAENAKLFFFDKEGSRWLGISGDGLYRYNYQNNTIQHFTSNNFDADGLSSNNILKIFPFCFFNQ